MILVRQLLKFCYVEQIVLDELTKFIDGVVTDGLQIIKDKAIVS